MSTSRFSAAQDPERLYMGDNPDPEDEVLDDLDEFDGFSIVDEDELISDLLALGMYEDAEAVWFTKAPGA